MDYKVVAVGDAYAKRGVEGLIELVRENIKSGWRPQGGISITKTNTEIIFSQAMVREDAETLDE